MSENQKFAFTQDYHIHTYISSCSSDPGQTPERLIQYAHDNGMSELCITDHLWDSAVPGVSDWYAPQNIEHVKKILPLPEDDSVTLHFGCETEMDKYFRLGLAEENFDQFEFIIIPTTHLHMQSFTISDEDWDNPDRRRELVVERMERLLERNYPFHKMGLAHMTCPLAAGRGDDRWEKHLKLFGGIPDKVYEDIFKKAAQVGIGIELNARVNKLDERGLDIIMRPYHIAKECGCKFYFGSDAHHPDSLITAPAEFVTWARELDLKESDRFNPFI